MMTIAIGASVLAFVAALALTSLTIRLSYKWRFLDQPDPRKVHSQATPRLGGVAIILAAFAAGIPAFCYLADTSTDAGWAQTKHYLALSIGALFVFGMGVIDDLWGVSSKLKLLTLLAASFVFSASGAGFNELVYDFQAFISFPWLSWILTAIWITGMAVAFNFIDGLDGLSGGLALMAFAVLGYFQLADSNYAAAVGPMVLSGAILGFLYFNRHPAKTFMGDAGSLTLGYLIGAITLAANADHSFGSMRAIVIPSLAMSVAIVDSGMTMFRRRYEQRRSMFTAERGHIHHRLIDRGLNHRQAVQVIHGVSALAIAIGILSLGFDGWSTLGGLSLLVPLLWGLFHAAGSVRTNEMVFAIRRKRDIDKTSRRYRTSFESLQLEFDEAKEFSHWWQTVCHAAEQLHFAQVELPIDAPADAKQRTFRWVNNTEDFDPARQRIDAKIPIPLFGAIGETATAEVRVPIVASLESAGERLALFSRLMAENGYSALRRINRLESPSKPEEEVDPGEFGHLRVAIVHESFHTYTGAERVVEQLIKIFPHCDVFGLFDFLADRDRPFLRGKKVHTTFLQKLPFARTKHQAYLPLMPLAIEQLDASQYDLVISSSQVAAKGVITGPDQLHICYCHSAPRYAWDQQQQYLQNKNLGYGPRGLLARIALHYIRCWDARATQGVDHFIASNQAVSRWIEKIYGHASEIIFPAVDTETFVPGDSGCREGYYFMAISSTDSEQVKQIIEAFERSSERRLIVCDASQGRRGARSSAGSNIDFIGPLDDTELSSYLQRSRAYVFAGERSNISPCEALACGTQVIACRHEAAVECVLGSLGGAFFELPMIGPILESLDQFEESEPFDEIDSKSLRMLAERHSCNQFIERVSDSVRKLSNVKWGLSQSTPREIKAKEKSLREIATTEGSEVEVSA